jgi:hypothetical protein
MKNRSTLVVALLLLGLGSWYYFYEVKGKDSREKSKEDAKLVFPGLDTAGVQEILIRKGSEDLALKKSAGDWMLTHPVQANADQAALASYLDSLKTIKKEEVVDETGKDLAAFGLAQPSATLVFDSGNSLSAKTLNFGMDNPTGQYSYAQVQGEAPIFMVMNYLHNSLVKEAKDLRDKKVLDFEPLQVTGLKSSFGRSLGIAAAKDGSWSLTTPFRDKGDHDKINAWLKQLADLRIDSFVSEDGKNAAKYGLAPPSAKMELSLAGQAKPLVLDQGRKLTGTAKGRYYRLEGKPLIFTLPDYASVTLEKKAEELSDKLAFGFQAGDVQSFEITRQGKTAKALKKDGVWSWDPPQPKKDGQPEADFMGFISGIASAEIKSRLPQGTKIPAPSMTLVFRGDKDAVLEKIDVGAVGKTGLSATSFAKKQAVEVAQDLFSKLPE